MTDETPNILIVDDKPANLIAMRRILQQLPAVLWEAGTGNEALGLCAEREFALVLLDVNMPGMDGYEVAELMSGAEQTRDVPIIFLTAAYSDDQHRLRGYHAGAVDYLQKPLDDAILLSKARVFLELFGRRREAQLAARMLAERNESLKEEIAQREETEIRLRQSEAQNKAILDTALDAIITLDAQGLVLDINPAGEKLFGFRREEMVGREAASLIVPKRKRHKHRQGLARILAGRGSEFLEKRQEIIAQRWDGAEFNAELAVTRAEVHGALVFTAFVQDITERLEMRRILEETLKAAEDHSRHKSAFLASMSHEIRTPMNAILGMAELLDETPLSGDQEKYLRVMRRAGEHLLMLINDILDLSKIEAGKLELESEPFDLYDLVETTLEMMTPGIVEKGLILHRSIDPETPKIVSGDAGRFRQILVNLIGNAVKFTEAGHVRVTVKADPGDRRGGAVLISVEDTGIGVAPEQQERIFSAFSQADLSTTRRSGGTGLGLTISRDLVRLMGGRLWMESEPGRGSAFHFTSRLPVGGALPETDGPSLRIEENPLSYAEAPASILLVDDAPDNILLVQAFLKNFPCRAEVAVDGREAVERFRNGAFDLVLMDVQMPVMDGLTATREIRRWEESNHRRRTPVVGLTAFAMKEDTWRILDAGCDMHLVKPIRKERLLAAVRRCLAESMRAEEAP